eukprot:2238081-Rhodomonas_salina.1
MSVPRVVEARAEAALRAHPRAGRPELDVVRALHRAAHPPRVLQAAPGLFVHRAPRQRERWHRHGEQGPAVRAG